MVHDPEPPDYEPVINPRKGRDSRRLEEEIRSRSGMVASKVERDFQPPPRVAEPLTSTSSQRDKVNASIVRGYISSPFLKRGHTISFFGLLLFTAFVYFRPYEWLPKLSFLSSAAQWIATFTL